MLKKTLLVTLLIFAAGTTALAEKKLAFTISPSIIKSYGETKYTMDLQGPLDDGTGTLRTATIRSELEFPLDITYAGFSAGLHPSNDPAAWSIEAHIQTSISDPDGKMTDDDWDGLDGIYNVTHFSSTESNTEGNAIILSLEVTYRIFNREPFSLSLFAGGRYQKIEQDINDFTGWVRPFDNIAMTYDAPVNIAGHVPALTYEITFKQPLAGLMARLQPRAGLSLDLKAAWAPVFYSDVDDHLLRSKLSLSDGDGHGALASFRLRYGTTRDYGATPFWDITSELVYINANGAQTQEWYVDETTGGGEVLVEEGTLLTGIPHEINSTQYNIGLRVGLEF